MAPSPSQQFYYYANSLLDLSEKVNRVSSIEDLIEARDLYVNWHSELKDFLLGQGLHQYSLINREDKVLSHCSAMGAGSVFCDDISRNLLTTLKQETKDKLQTLDHLSPHFPGLYVVQRGTDFFYSHRPVKIGQSSRPYRLLLVLYTYGDDKGFLSYDDISCQLAKLSKDDQDVNSKDIQNARDELFVRAKLQISKNKEEPFVNITPDGRELMSVKRGEGLIFNNTPPNP